MISSLTCSEVSTSSSRASSWAALRSNSRACSRRFIEHFAFGGRLEINIPRCVTPVIELLCAHHQQIHRDVKRTQQPIQSYHLSGTIRNAFLDYHDVEVTVFTGLAARLRTEHDYAFGLGGLSDQLCQPLDRLAVPNRVFRVQTLLLASVSHTWAAINPNSHLPSPESTAHAGFRARQTNDEGHPSECGI